MASLKQQIHNNAVALISLVIAVSSLAYNTWRNETTESQRNTRHAAFRVLESLGELQEVVDFRYYYLSFADDEGQERETRLRGYGSVAMVRDLTGLMPGDAPAAGSQLNQVWINEFGQLNKLAPGGQHSREAIAAEQALTRAINETRQAVLEVLTRLE